MTHIAVCGSEVQEYGGIVWEGSFMKGFLLPNGEVSPWNTKITMTDREEIIIIITAFLLQLCSFSYRS